jgi:hypothetical protein
MSQVQQPEVIWDSLSINIVIFILLFGCFFAAYLLQESIGYFLNKALLEAYILRGGV